MDIDSFLASVDGLKHDVEELDAIQKAKKVKTPSKPLTKPQDQKVPDEEIESPEDEELTVDDGPYNQPDEGEDIWQKKPQKPTRT